MPERVLVAMSGGVDSSVAAALLLEAGYDVIGATMLVGPAGTPPGGSGGQNGVSPAVCDAGQVAQALGIPHHVIDLREIFEAEVVRPFAEAYLAGVTPNPCLYCNKRVKFGALLDRARGLGAAFFATGHYVRAHFSQARGRHLLLRGLDPGKDQSYALYGLSQEQLAACLFPLGELRKEEVRAHARRLGLLVADKDESQEICFVPDNDYPGFLQSYLSRAPFEVNEASDSARANPLSPGPIVDAGGRVLGEHAGVAHYTVGQRRGLGLTAPEPLYVLELRPQTNEVVVGPASELYGKELTAQGVNWIAYDTPPAVLRAQAKIRYSASPAWAEIRPLEGGKAAVRFDEPQRAIAPGQAVVFYQDDMVLGGGIISRTRPENSL